MGLFDFFSSKPSEKAILNQVNKAKERYAQPDYRRAAMDKLLKWNTPESIAGLLERFTVVVQSPHWDEEEKNWLAEELIAQGKDVEKVVSEFILKKDEITQCLAVIKSILNDDKQYTNLLLEALNKRPPSDYRLVRSKKELIAALIDLNVNGLDEVIIPYLEDHSDDVQCAAIDYLIKSEREETRQKLMQLLENNLHSARVLRTLAKLFSDMQLPLKKEIVLADAVKEEFTIKTGLLVKIK